MAAEQSVPSSWIVLFVARALATAAGALVFVGGAPLP
jgi:hypothetical protein